MGGKSTSTSATKVNQISVQSSSLGLPITIGWGRARINCNLLWYGAFNAIAHTTKQSSGGKGMGGSVSNTTYTYTASIILGLCEGGASGIQDVRTVYRDKSALTLSGAGLSLAVGTPTQATWGYLTSKFPSQAINYSGLAYVYAQDYTLNDSATLPNHSFEVDFGIQLSGAANGDADPRDILTDFFTNTGYGVPGWPSGAIGNLSDYSLYCRANNLLLSPVLDSQQSASNIVAEWMTATNSEAVWSEGLLKVGSYGDAAATGNSVTWTPNLTPAYDLTEDDFIPVDGKPVKLEIVDQSDAYNIVQVEFLDRANQYNTGIAAAQDLANIVQYGRRKQDPTTLHSICDSGIAMHAATLLLQRSLYMRERYTFTIPDIYALLEPMIDTVTLTTTTDELRLNRKQVRLIHITENANGTFTCIAIGMDIGTASAALYNAHSGSGYVPNIDVAPGSVSTPVLINAPTSLTGGAPEVWIAAGSTNPNWGGCEVWVSADDIQYHKVGSITSAARTGVSTATLASHVDPDTVDTLSVDLTASQGVLSSSNAANANIGSTLCLIGNEIVGYQTATLTSANHYNLTTLRRGLYGTTIGAHSSGSVFARLDEALFKYDYGSLALGTTIYVKLPSFNVYGRAIEDISTVLAYTVQLAPNVTIGSGSLQSFTLVNRENCYIDGRTVSKITGSNAWGDASVVSSESFIGGCMCGFQAVNTAGEYMIGLNADPATDDTYTSIDFAWHLDTSGVASIYESGSLVGSTFSYAATDTFQIIYQGTTVTYLQNGTTRRTATTTSGLQLWLDSAFKTIGGKATNVTFAGTGAGSDGYSTNVVTLWQRAATAPATPTNDVTYTFATQAMSPAPNNSWLTAPPAPNGLQLWATQQVAYANMPTVLLPHASWATPVQATADGFTSAVVYLYQRATSAPAVPSGSLTYTFATGGVAGGTLGSWTTSDPGGTNPCYRIQAVAFAAAGSATDTILNTEWSSPAIYSQNGAPGSSGAGAFTIVNQVNTTVSGNTVTKTGGSGGSYDAAAHSVESFAGGATVGFTGPGSTQEAIVGLSTNPTASASYDLDYGIVKRAGGTWEIWEGGSYAGVSGSGANGAQFQVTYTGTTVVYQQNGTVIKTTSGVAAGRTFYLDMSLSTSGCVVSGLTFAKAGADGTGGGSTATTSPISSTNSGGGSGNSTTTTVGNQFKTTATVTMTWDGQIYYASGGLGTTNLTFYLEYTTDPQRVSGWTTAGTNGPIAFNSAASPYDNSFSGTFTPAINTAYYYRLRSASTGAAILVNVVGGLTATQ